MAGYNLKKSSEFIAEAEIVREARRIFRRLAQPNAHIALVNGDCYALHFGARLDRRVQKVSSAVVERFLAKGWLMPGATEDAFVLSESGAGWLARAECANDDPFLEQHQLRETRLVASDDGVRHEVVFNAGEDPLGWMLSRRVVSREQYDAGERLRRDYTYASLAPRLAMDLEAPVVLKSRNPSHNTSDTAIAAGQRFRMALRAAGPGLSDLLFDVCCDLKGLEEAERSRDWPRRSAKVVLCIALDRLTAHYGIAMQAPARGAVRSWIMEDSAKN